MVVTEVRSHIDGVADAAKGQSSADSELVGKGAGEEADNSKGRVQSRVGAVVGGWVQLASAAHAVQSVKHARAHEADEGDDDELDRWRGKPWQLEARDGDAPVHP